MEKHVTNMNIIKKGGFVGHTPSALMSVLKVVIGVFKFIGRLLVFIIRTFYPYIIKFLGFCIIASILLTLFGFFGIFFTFCAIFLIYYKLYNKIILGNLKFAAELNKKVGESNSSYALRESGLLSQVKSIKKAITIKPNLKKANKIKNMLRDTPEIKA